MIKKEYLKPEVTVVVIDGKEQILAGSGPSSDPVFGDDDTGVSAGDNADPGFGTNSYSIWED